MQSSGYRASQTGGFGNPMLLGAVTDATSVTSTGLRPLANEPRLNSAGPTSRFLKEAGPQEANDDPLKTGQNEGIGTS
jgi:hypothetical protein